jgi:hypothetical protein
MRTTACVSGSWSNRVSTSVNDVPIKDPQCRQLSTARFPAWLAR